jgi:hypothetical protein
MNGAGIKKVEEKFTPLLKKKKAGIYRLFFSQSLYVCQLFTFSAVLALPAQHDLPAEAPLTQQDFPLALVVFEQPDPSILTGDTLTNVLVVASKFTSTYETLPVCASVSFLTYETLPVTGHVLDSIVASKEATFAAAVDCVLKLAAATDGALDWQEALAAAGLVHVLLQEDFCACAPTMIKERKKSEKRTFFI